MTRRIACSGVAITIGCVVVAINRPQEFRIHVKGALANGCTREEIREVLLLVAMYCGVPASNESHRIALEVFGEA